jgi:hypothetical protein
MSGKPCFLCGESEHRFRCCPHFQALAACTSAVDYVDRELRENDRAGFCSAGVLPYCVTAKGILFLMVHEERRGERAWTLLAGKREPRLGAPALETYRQTAMRELLEECDEFSVPRDHAYFIASDAWEAPVMWCAASKMAVLLVKCPDDFVQVTNTQGWRSPLNPYVDLHQYARPLFAAALKHLSPE